MNQSVTQLWITAQDGRGGMTKIQIYAAPGYAGSGRVIFQKEVGDGAGKIDILSLREADLVALIPHLIAIRKMLAAAGPS